MHLAATFRTACELQIRQREYGLARRCIRAEAMMKVKDEGHGSMRLMILECEQIHVVGACSFR